MTPQPSLQFGHKAYLQSRSYGPLVWAPLLLNPSHPTYDTSITHLRNRGSEPFKKEQGPIPGTAPRRDLCHPDPKIRGSADGILSWGVLMRRYDKIPTFWGLHEGSWCWKLPFVKPSKNQKKLSSLNAGKNASTNPNITTKAFRAPSDRTQSKYWQRFRLRSCAVSSE